jgi:hypothetical protein
LSTVSSSNTKTPINGDSKKIPKPSLLSLSDFDDRLIIIRITPNIITKKLIISQVIKKGLSFISTLLHKLTKEPSL